MSKTYTTRFNATRAAKSAHVDPTLVHEIEPGKWAFEVATEQAEQVEPVTTETLPDEFGATERLAALFTAPVEVAAVVAKDAEEVGERLAARFAEREEVEIPEFLKRGRVSLAEAIHELPVAEQPAPPPPAPKKSTKPGPAKGTKRAKKHATPAGKSRGDVLIDLARRPGGVTVEEMRQETGLKDVSTQLRDTCARRGIRLDLVKGAAKGEPSRYCVVDGPMVRPIPASLRRSTVKA